MTEQEARHEAEKLIQLFSMCSSFKPDTKKAGIFCMMREIELLEGINKDKFIVHWSQEKFNKLLEDKNMILHELKNYPYASVE